MIYPDSIGKMDLEAARAYAEKRSAEDRGVTYRVEDCDTEKVLARFRNGVEMSQEPLR